MKSQSSHNEFQVQIWSFCEIAIFSQRVSRGHECQNKHLKTSTYMSRLQMQGPDQCPLIKLSRCQNKHLKTSTYISRLQMQGPDQCPVIKLSRVQ